MSTKSSAISELTLPALDSGISTMRLEELIWHRAVVPEQVDVQVNYTWQTECGLKMRPKYMQAVFLTT